jgi:hypothetical protein
MKKKYKIGSVLLLGATGLALVAPSASAQVFTYNNQDLLLGFRRAGASDFVVDIGPLKNYGPGTTTLSQFNSSQLAAAFGSSLDGISLTVGGDVSTSGTPVPNHTLWIASARTDINTQTTPWQTRNFIAQGNTIAPINSLGANTATYSAGQPAGPNNTPTAVVLPPGSTFYTTSAGASGNWANTFPGVVEATTPTGFTAGTTPVRLDLYTLVPGSTPVPGTFDGYFDFKPNGTATFTVVPEPSAWAVIGGGACLLFAALQRRRIHSGFGLNGQDTPKQG